MRREWGWHSPQITEGEDVAKSEMGEVEGSHEAETASVDQLSLMLLSGVNPAQPAELGCP